MNIYKIKELKWEIVDFDGTLCFTSPDDDFALETAKPNLALIKDLQAAYKNGKRMIIYTARHWDDYPILEDWLNKYEVPFKFIICGKILAHTYIDDRAVNPNCKECMIKWKKQ